MGGKISSPRNYKNGSGAVIFKNNYAVQDEFYQPVYVMGYVNNFAIEQYEGNDPDEGLPCETYDEDDVFAGCAAKANDVSSLQNDKLLIWDGRVLNVATATGPNDRSIVLINNIIDPESRNKILNTPNNCDVQRKAENDHNVIIHASSLDKLTDSKDNLYEDIDTDEIERDSITEKQNIENTEKECSEQE